MRTDINTLTKGWTNLTYKLIDQKEINDNELQELLSQAYEVLFFHSICKSVPKDVCRMIIELKEFDYFCSFLDEDKTGIDFAKYQRIHVTIESIISRFFDNNYEVDFPKLIINDEPNKEIVINFETNIFN